MSTEPAFRKFYIYQESTISLQQRMHSRELFYRLLARPSLVRNRTILLIKKKYMSGHDIYEKNSKKEKSMNTKERRNNKQKNSRIANELFPMTKEIEAHKDAQMIQNNCTFRTTSKNWVQQLKLHSLNTPFFFLFPKSKCYQTVEKQ